MKHSKNKMLFLGLIVALVGVSPLVFAKSAKTPPPKSSTKFATDKQMALLTKDFAKLYEGVGFLSMMGAKKALLHVDNNNKSRNVDMLRRVCDTLLYRLGSSTPMALYKGKNRVATMTLSLRDERETYRYILFRKSPFLWLSRYNDGGKYARYVRDPKLALKRSEQFVEWNKDYLPFAKTIGYYVHAVNTGKEKLEMEKQDRNNPVYLSYRDRLCPSGGPYESVYDFTLDYIKTLRIDPSKNSAW